MADRSESPARVPLTVGLGSALFDCNGWTDGADASTGGSQTAAGVSFNFEDARADDEVPTRPQQ